MVREAWNKQVLGSRAYRMSKKVKECKVVLSRWSRMLKRNTKKEIDRLKGEIQRLKNLARQENQDSINQLKSKLAKAYKNEELFWA